MANPENTVPSPEPLEACHLPSQGDTADRVQLLGLREIQGVNALAPDQQMSFESDGMTIVFGYNGSGKSSYARILRQLCHARHRGDQILPNAFVTGEQPTPSAMIDFRVAGSDRSETWQQGLAQPADLGRVSFFDAECAAVHVNKANELDFTPFGLDVLPKLATVCRRISEAINTLLAEQGRAKPVSLATPSANEGTEVRTILTRLNENSDIEDFRRLAGLSENDSERLAELREVLGTDPATRARELRNAARRLSPASRVLRWR